MKIVKRVLIGLAIFLVILIAAAAILPSFFKDDIKAAIDKQIAKSVNADVLFDVNNFNLSVFRNFPNITAQIKDLGVFNRAPFEGEPLFVVHEFEVEINLSDVLFGDQLRLKGITLINPQISIKVLADGRANYDIAIPSADTVKTTEESSDFSFGIDHWEIENGSVVYDDKSIPYFLSIKGLQHSGSGDFTEEVFDLRTHTVADTVTTAMGDMQFLTNKRAEIDAVISISEDITRYTFKENTAKINDFGLSFDGWIKMNPDNFDMDITFKSPANSFKSILSLVPGMYTKDFKSIETKGDLQFAGFAKGIYNEKKMPAFNLNLTVKDAMFKYPDLPTAINNINMDLLIDNKDGVIENTVVNLKKLHLDLGANPVDAKLLIENLRNYRMDANIKAKLNLADLTKMIPMEGLEMKGLYSIDAGAKGVYDSIKKIIPAVDAKMSLNNGYVKSDKFPMPLQDVTMSGTVKNTSGKMAETIISVDDFSMMMDGEKLTASMVLRNLDDYTWDIKANGGVDLEKITKIFPLEGMTLAGKVKANIETRGKMSDVDAKRYDRLPTSGSASLKDFKYESKGMPALTLSTTVATFDPMKIELTKMDGTIGKSDFSVTGTVTNYIAYVINKATIKGTVNFSSRLLDMNEFMTEEEAPQASADTSSFGVIPIPENIDFVLKSNVATAKMMEYTITNASGDVVLKNGIANLSNLRFMMLGGTFVLNGSYNAKDVKHPKYDMDIKIENLAIQQAANSFSIVKAYVPIAGLVNGNFSTDFKLNGELTKGMMPNLTTVNGGGLIKIAEAAVTKSKLVAGITSLTKLENSDQVNLKDVLMTATLTNGRFSVKPFEAKLGSHAATIAGSTGLDKSIDYQVKTIVPVSGLGPQPVTIVMGGTVDNPTYKLDLTEQKEAAKAVVQEKATDAAKKILEGQKPEDVLKGILTKPKADTTKKKDSVTTQPQQKQEPAKEAAKELQNKLNNLLKRKN